MKKNIISFTAAALCASALTTRAFAADILTDRSVYANDKMSIAQSIKKWEYEGKTIMPDPDTIIPIYGASIYDYAKTGNFEVAPLMLIDGDGTTTDYQHYICDAMDENGNYAGEMGLVVDGKNNRISYLTSSSKNDVKSVVFDSDAKRIDALMKKRSFNTNCDNIKLVLVEGLGYVYLIESGEDRFLAATHLDRVNGNFFDGRNGGLVAIDEDLKAKADAELESYNAYLEEWQKIVDATPPDTPLPTGGYETPMYTVDNTPYLNSADTPSTPDNPNTGSDTSKHTAALAVELGLVSAMIIGGAIVSKKRKNDR